MFLTRQQQVRLLAPQRSHLALLLLLLLLQPSGTHPHLPSTPVTPDQSQRHQQQRQRHQQRHLLPSCLCQQSLAVRQSSQLPWLQGVHPPQQQQRRRRPRSARPLLLCRAQARPLLPLPHDQCCQACASGTLDCRARLLLLLLLLLLLVDGLHGQCPVRADVGVLNATGA
jgi:hypothetical protein